MRSSRRLVATAVISAASALVLLGCTAATDTRSETSAPPRTPTAEASAAPSPSATIDIPTEPVAGEIASAVSDRLSTPSSSSSVAGPGIMVADRPFSIEGECLGTRADYSLTTADPADAGRVLVEGTIECGAPMTSSVGSTAGYAGVVQLSFTDTDGIDRAWLRVVQP
ncbi:hypothetical protein [Microbacterium sp. RU33B]|uniref:hypothetical protein n=1 Tax=Microbacterium sp. RU33B TaxID=1907390 RepID=UPI00095C43E7|nr:hypothetical protein [Microbacterium sp. RU33B]SIT84861.1 hypothetical protein SAMN05880545_2251 [Microbacterium sp. RU33B]